MSQEDVTAAAEQKKQDRIEQLQRRIQRLYDAYSMSFCNDDKSPPRYVASKFKWIADILECMKMELCELQGKEYTEDRAYDFEGFSFCSDDEEDD